MATTNYGVECPECGSIRNRTDSASLDSNGHRIRQRVCEGCGGYFTSVEIVFPFSFSGADALKRELYRDAKQPPRRSLDYFRVNEIESPVRNRVVRSVTVSLVRGTPSNLCRKGLHRLAGDNVYVNPTTGNRVCQPCRREAARARYHHAMQNEPPAIRDERRARIRAANEKRRAYKREWARRKRQERAA